MLTLTARSAPGSARHAISRCHNAAISPHGVHLQTQCTTTNSALTFAQAGLGKLCAVQAEQGKRAHAQSHSCSPVCAVMGKGTRVSQGQKRSTASNALRLPRPAASMRFPKNLSHTQLTHSYFLLIACALPLASTRNRRLVMIAVVPLFLNLSAAFAVFGWLFPHYFPRVHLLECIAMSIPVGMTLSAWCALLLKSVLPTGSVLLFKNNSFPLHALRRPM